MQNTLAIRTDREVLLDELRSAGADVKRPNEIRCPFHDDREPSSGVYQGEDGAWRFKCQSSCCGFGGDIFDVRAKVSGRPLADVLIESTPRSTSKPKKPVHASPEVIGEKLPGRVEQVFKYTDPDTGHIDLAVIRWLDSGGKKRFVQCRQVDGGFVCEAPPKPWPIYNRARLRKAEVVVLVEGEKPVHAMHEVGIVATTSPAGAGKASFADWSPLAGKTVYLWPDNDPVDPKTKSRTGIAHMRDVAKILSTLDPVPRTFWIDPDTLSLPPKGDVVDFLEMHADQDTETQRLLLQNVLADAQSLGAAGEMRELMNDITSGRRAAIAWPWRATSRLSKSLFPGTVTLLCGDPGSLKSFVLLQAATHWHDQGVKIALLELEEDRKYHLHRALAQRMELSALFDDEWVRDNKDIATAAVETHAEFFDRFGACIHEPAGDSIEAVAEWVEKMAMAGNRIIAIDPITAAAKSDRPYQDDLRFMMRVKEIARQFECSVILVTHPRAGRKNSMTLEDLAGGMAYPRFSQSIIWLQRLAKPKVHTIMNSITVGTMREVVSTDRIVHILKARNGPGAGLQIAFEFSPKTLKFSELGIITRDDAAGDA